MKIVDVHFVPVEGGFYFDDQAAIKDGAAHDGFDYLGVPVTPGFRRVREVAEALSVLLVLDDGQVACGDCAAVTYTGAAGRDPIFRARAQAEVARRVVVPALRRRSVDTFRELATEVDELRDAATGRRLHAAVRYGVTQALLDAVARSRRCTMAEVVAEEYDLTPQWRPVACYCQSGDHRQEHVDKMILRGADVLPHGLIKSLSDEVGYDGGILLEYVGWVARRVQQLRPDLRPVLHFDVYGNLSKVFGQTDFDAIARYLGRLERAAAPFELQIEAPIDLGDPAAQLEGLFELMACKRRAGVQVRIVADEWCNTLEDVHEYIRLRAVDMIQVKTPDLGGIQNSIEAVLACQATGMRSFLGGTCSETDRSAVVCTHVALATQPDQMLVKPGLGVDEGLMIVRNEMARTLALIAGRRA